MNFLAHAYLSFEKPALLIGNMISDFVKGKEKFNYSENIQIGIQLHRDIDEYTDEHPVTKEARKIFAPDYGLYSSPLMDIAYDYFLANDSTIFTDESLFSFSQRSYSTLDEYITVLPNRFQLILPYMKKYNWLYGYREMKGIERSFEGLVHRSSFLKETHTAFSLFKKHNAELTGYYREFFPGIKSFVLNHPALKES